jgi:hypothetical protein
VLRKKIANIINLNNFTPKVYMNQDVIYLILSIYNIFILFTVLTTKDFKYLVFCLMWCLFALKIRWDTITYLNFTMMLLVLIISIFKLVHRNDRKKFFFIPPFLAFIPLMLYFTLKNENGFEIKHVFGPGNYTVIHGGSISFLNHHSKSNSQRFAADIVKLNSRFFSSRNNFFSEELEHFESYQTTIFAPCEGKVISLENGKNDVNFNKDLSDLKGNYLEILCSEGTKVLLAHLHKGSIRVGLNVNVKTGDAIALIGNSGNSSEPHLHIQANNFSDGLPIDLRYNGRRLFRNKLLVN